MIVAVPKNTLTAAQKSKLSKKGYIVIETENPESVRLIQPEISIETNELLMSSLKALTTAHPVGKAEFFANELYSRLDKISKK